MRGTRLAGLKLMTMLTLIAAAGGTAAAQGQGDIEAINRLIDRYGELEDLMDMGAQAVLMTEDRVWVSAGGRRTDQERNMLIQQAELDALRAATPGIRTFTEDRDRLIRFYGNGTVAVASFYRYTTTVVSSPGTEAGTPAPPVTPPAVGTLVLESQGGEWKIVHTHFANLQLSSD